MPDIIGSKHFLAHNAKELSEVSEMSAPFREEDSDTGEVQEFIQNHIAGYWQSQILNPGT